MFERPGPSLQSVQSYLFLNTILSIVGEIALYSSLLRRIRKSGEKNHQYSSTCVRKVLIGCFRILQQQKIAMQKPIPDKQQGEPVRTSHNRLVAPIPRQPPRNFIPNLYPGGAFVLAPRSHGFDPISTRAPAGSGSDARAPFHLPVSLPSWFNAFLIFFSCFFFIIFPFISIFCLFSVVRRFSFYLHNAGNRMRIDET